MQGGTNQYDITSRELLSGRKQPLARYTEIGDVCIVNTVFGKAKVQVTRASDRRRRSWLLSILMVTLLVAAIWQMLIVSQQAELSVPPVPLGSRIKVSPPVHQPEYSPTSLREAAKPGVRTPVPQNIIAIPLQKSLPPRPSAIQATPKAAMAPAPVATEMAIKAGEDAQGVDKGQNVQADMQHSLMAPIQPASQIINILPPSAQAVEKPGVVQSAEKDGPPVFQADTDAEVSSDEAVPTQQ